MRHNFSDREVAKAASLKSSKTFKPGQSGNPSGRPKRKPVLDQIEKYLKQNPAALKGIVNAAFRQASGGDVQYFKEIRDMLDGKPATVLAGDEDAPLGGDVVVNVIFGAEGETKK